MRRARTALVLAAITITGMLLAGMAGQAALTRAGQQPGAGIVRGARR